MTPPEAFPIICIGASAGGIEALEGFFRGLPAEPGLALVIVTHLSPERESVLHEIVARYTALPVHVAADAIRVQNNHVYVMPAKAILGIKDRRLTLRKSGSYRQHKPIDIFMSALAVDIGELAGGVILSGGDGDGTLGVKAIKERGGITFAQVGDGFGPQHPDMPEAAISSGLIDFAIPVEDMGRKLVEFVRANDLLKQIIDDTPESSEEPTIGASLPEIYTILRNQTGHDFSGYKTKTFVRRIQRRMQVTQLATIEAYVERLRQEPPEVGALFRDLLINVTNFFRDEDAFEALAASVIPRIFEGLGADATVRIWVPGCATGEEVFSIAILAREHMDTLTAAPRVQIFATDIDERALSVARAARYPGPLLDTVSPERRKRFFVSDGVSYVVSKDVRDLCIFSPHSVIRDPPFSRIDLVSCRNLLIYFGADVQNQVIPTFHYALRPDGYLFLGTAENASQFADLFAPIEKRHRIFRRRSDASAPKRLPIALHGAQPGPATNLSPRRQPLVGLALRQAVEEHVVEQFAPPHVVVNRDGDVVYYSSRTGKYLEAPAGAPTRQLLTMARKGLRLDLRTLFREAIETGRMATRNGVSLDTEDGEIQRVNLTIGPLDDVGSGEPLLLVLFADQGPVLSREEALNRAQIGHGDPAAHLERELRETRDRLQSMIEEYETALEELKSSNEELVSVNEEMQSTNEELEASKEELQSVNEELHTVNAELHGKVDALDRANSDLQNLFESTDVATIFLDRKLVIRSFTPAVTKVFNILPTDKGRPITDLSSRLNLTGFSDDIAKVFAGADPIERRVGGEGQDPHYLVRLAPYRDGDRKIRGVVVTFIDVTSLTHSEARQRVLIAELQHRTRNLLSIVQALAQQTLGNGGSLQEFSTRLAALGRVQSLVTKASDDQLDLGDIIRSELQAVGAADDKVSVSGPAVPLGFELVQMIGLALHELTTNAVKHGALKDGQGRLDVSWRVQRNGRSAPNLLLTWKESGVPKMPKPSQKGFGRNLIERALAHTSGAKSEFRFGQDGISCQIQLPIPRAIDVVANQEAGE
ncbi:CheR family methyltransferase [Bradyrhizobium sp. 192]|uniref:CheR family methyltransferase n=1 Tax=Bradyrhizobium sp. 192 TaxID=2782660 RepID=UPI001FFF53DA|nr:CheR family methyltransferase [Bradyrhizobium sp. 192]UPJ56945.1 PAS domain-containing protein [Bradyrhizobium sp. 192]